MKNIPSMRLTGFDAIRGAAMLFVFVSHFLDEYILAGLPKSQWFELFVAVCRVATPTFFLVSGIMLGYLHRTIGEHFHEFRIHLIDKALFLLSIGHILVAACTAAKLGFYPSIGTGHVTDTLAFCAIISLLLIPKMRTGVRFWGGILLYSASWASWYFWTPESPIAEVLRGILLGPQRDGTLIFLFPLLPWLGVHLIGGSLGEQFGQVRFSDLYEQVGRSLVKIGAALLLAGLLLRALYETLLSAGLLQSSGTMYRFFSPYQKYPPGPAYLLFFGGAAFLLMSALLFAKRSQWFKGPMRIMETLGRNSLLAFLLQFFVYYTVLHWLVAKTTFITPMTAWMFLLLSVVGLMVLVMLLDRHNIQRLWTVGLPWLIQHSTLHQSLGFPPDSSQRSSSERKRVAVRSRS